MTKSYHELEASTYKNSGIKAQQALWETNVQHNKDLLLEAGEVALDCDVHYDWSRDYRLLATIIGPQRYSTEVGFNSVEPVQPPTMHPPHIQSSTALQIQT